jgi:23S rRNA pseudouridine2604 synthase
MSEPVRLAKRVIELTGCSRADADRFIEGGWVSVDGEVVETPQHKVSTETVLVDPAAQAEASEPATFLLHRPAGSEVEITSPERRITAETRWSEDATGIRMLRRQLAHLTALLPLDLEASGLTVLSQDGRVARRLTEDARLIEQEYVVDVTGEVAPYGLQRLGLGVRLADRTLPPCKVSWQSETRLRFAIKGVQPGDLRAMCAAVGLDAVAQRRLRIGRIGLAKMPVGAWRFLPVGEKF